MMRKGIRHSDATLGATTRIVVCYTMTLLLVALFCAGCSQRPRQRYASELHKKLCALERALEQCRVFPAGTTEVESTAVFSKGGLAATKTKMSYTYAEDVAHRAEALADALTEVSYDSFSDIRDSVDYEEWVSGVVAKLAEDVQRCNAILDEMKRDYHDNPSNVLYTATLSIGGMPFYGRQYKVLWLVDGELAFADGPGTGSGFVPARVLKVDFRSGLDGIRHPQKATDQSQTNTPGVARPGQQGEPSDRQE